MINTNIEGINEREEGSNAGLRRSKPKEPTTRLTGDVGF